MYLAIASSDWLGLAALIASFTGVIATVFSIRYSRKDATRQAAQQCHEKLLQAQREAETLSEELFTMRMQQYGGYGLHDQRVQLKVVADEDI